MSVHPFPRRPVPSLPVEPYYQEQPNRDPVVPLRPMTAVEQMYAYWGWDRLGA